MSAHRPAPDFLIHTLQPASHTRSVCLVVLIILATWQTTQAQSSQTSPSDELPPTEQLVWRPQFAITSLGYDSNVLNQAENPKGDFVSTFGAKLRPIWQVGPVKVSGETGVSYNYFATLTTERGADATARGRVELKLGVAKLHVTESYINLKERFNAEIDTRARRGEDATEGGVDFSVTDRTTLSLGAEQSGTTFNKGTPEGFDLGRTLDRRQRLVTAAWRYAVTPLTSIIASGLTGTHRFEGAPERDGNREGFEAGVEMTEDALIAGHATIGWRRMTLKNPNIPNYSGVAGSANVSTRLGESTRVGLQAHRDVTFSFSDYRPYYVEKGLGASISQMLTENFEVGAHARRMWFDYVQPLNELVGNQYRERIDFVGASIGYRLPSGYRISVNIENQRRRTNGDASRLYDNIRIFTAITPVLSF
jgi:hypothetical protein